MTEKSATSVNELVRDALAWISQHWDPRETVTAWWDKVAEAGLQFASWPDGLGGRGTTKAEERAVHEVMAESGVLGPPFNLGPITGGPSILSFGTVEQRRRLLPQLASGREGWCQLFSEPDAGSDLAAVRTRASRDGDRWVIEGQKIWSSGARQSDRGMLLARTGPPDTRHKGLSFFIVDLHQPNVEVRPIKQMNGVSGHFNETYLTGAIVDDADLIGGEGQGWSVALNVLALERSALHARVPNLVYGTPGKGWGQLDRPAGEVVNEGAQASEYVANRAWVDSRRLIALAQRRGMAQDPVMRQDLARLAAVESIIEWTVRRQDVPASANLVKLAKSNVSRLAARVGLGTLGAAGTLIGPDAPERGELAYLALTAPSFSIAGGTDEIQRNVIAERGLGLPR